MYTIFTEINNKEVVVGTADTEEEKDNFVKNFNSFYNEWDEPWFPLTTKHTSYTTDGCIRQPKSLTGE